MMIIPMTDDHVAPIAQLETICFSDPWSENSVASELKNPLALWLTALEEGTVVGYIGSQTVFPEADIMNIAVHPDHRRKGIAQALIHALESHLKQQGVESLTLEVRASNISAISLYQKLGFQEVGRRRNYYRNPKEDALILKKEWGA